MLKGGVTCAKCGAKKNVVRYFAAGGRTVAVCDDCWRRMKKPRRREFLNSFAPAGNEKREGEDKQ